MTKWWQKAIGYQIYIKSFYDDNDDGIGDLLGIYKKLDYLRDLGVNLVWINPFYDSPMDDNGYDVRNFCKVSPMFGSIEAFKKVLEKAHKLGIKVIIDFVLNHTSDEHNWFIEAKKSKDNYYHDFYIWAKGRKDNNILEPTNWQGFFNKPVWKYEKNLDLYYFTLFSDKMPDLNWKSENMRNEMYKVINFWLDLGVDGFRLDAISHLGKAENEDSFIYKSKYVCDMSKFSNLDEVKIYLDLIKQNCYKDKDILTIGETGGGASIDKGLEYANFTEGAINMVFNFDHNWCLDENNKLDCVKYKNIWKAWQDKFNDNGWLPLNFLNHDQPRVISQYGHKDFKLESMKALATFLYLMKGTPFIYNGEEIGMTNYNFTKYDEIRDISFINKVNLEKEESNLSLDELVKKFSFQSRDNSRTPMQWNNLKYAGFSKKEPWINVNPNYKEINVEIELKNPDSILNYYKKIIKLRNNPKYFDSLILSKVDFKDLENKKILSYYRKNLFILVNYSEFEYDYFIDSNEYNIILNNYDSINIRDKVIKLLPYQAIVLEF